MYKIYLKLLSFIGTVLQIDTWYFVMLVLL
jgi:hypothetical protein